jgi:hypothetical protein
MPDQPPRSRSSRRLWLKQFAAIATSPALVRWTPAVAAESKSSAAVNALPRHALVIGNTRYEDMPLKNPGNDAAAIGAVLKSSVST